MLRVIQDAVDFHVVAALIISILFRIFCILLKTPAPIHLGALVFTALVGTLIAGTHAYENRDHGAKVTATYLVVNGALILGVSMLWAL